MAFNDNLVLALILISMLSAHHEVLALFPKVCVSSESLSAKECCPVPEGFEEKCGGPGRGECVDLQLSVIDPVGLFDGDLERFQWPTSFFNRTCKCEGNFDGASCSVCKFGWTGVNCNSTKKSTRRNILSMSTQEVNQFKNYLLLAKEKVDDYVIPTALYRDMDIDNEPQFNDISTYDRYVWYHYYTSRENLIDKSRRSHDNGAQEDGKVTSADFAHEGPTFLTWHRAYLLSWEQALRQVSGDDDFTLPYWDWAGESECTVCTDEYMGASDTSNNHTLTGAFSNWTTLCYNFGALQANGSLCTNKASSQMLPGLSRNPGGDSDRPEVQVLPSKEAVYYALSVRSYDKVPLEYDPLSNKWTDSPCSFRNILEGFGDSENFIGLHASGVHQLHNQVHLYLNGTMSDVPISANDPIFLLHHCNIDRIFEKWLRRHNVTSEEFPDKSTPVGHGRDSNLVPFFPVHTNGEFFKRSETFGYTYDDIDEEGLPTDPQERKRETSAVERMPKCSIPSDNQTKEIRLYIIVAVGVLAVLVCVAIGIGIWRCKRKENLYQEL
ncbi:tyrosinase-like [Glandiceps talaboti]